MKIGTITDEVVDGCPSSAASTINEYFGMSYLNSDKSWIMNYVSSLHEKEENFDNLSCESSQPAVEDDAKGLHDSNNVEKKNESSFVHRETISFTMRVKPDLLEEQQRRQRQILCRCIREQSPTTEKEEDPSRGQNLDFDSLMTYVEKTLLENLIFKYVYFDTLVDVTVKMREQH